MKTFEELYCYQKTVEVRKKISKLMKSFPADEKYRLVDQMLRASRSAPAQIAEDYGRYHYQENVQYCRQGRGSLYELIDHLLPAKEEGFITEEALISLKGEIIECIAVLNGFINYLMKAKASSSKVGEPLPVYGDIPIND